MNTIEQAREFSKALRIRSAYGSEARQAVDTIDALLAELAALKGQEPVLWQSRSKPDWEQRLTHTLRTTTEALKQVTAERDALRADAAHMTEAIMHAYGHLWHVNTEPMAPIPLRSPEAAACEARKILRDMLTNEQRGIAINAIDLAMKGKS